MRVFAATAAWTSVCASEAAAPDDNPPSACSAVLEMANAGTLRQSLSPFLEGSSPSIDWGDEDSERDAEPEGIFRNEGMDYVVWINGEDQLEFLTLADAARATTIVCEFAQREERSRKLFEGDGAACEAVLTGRAKLVEFSADPKRLDIDNDGKPELIVKSEAQFRADNSCERAGLSIHREAGELEINDARQALLDQAPGECGTTKAFEDAGHRYLITEGAWRFPHQLDAVWKLAGNRIEKQCLIQSLPINFLLTRHEAFVREARRRHQSPWELAMERPGLDSAKLLLANGHSPNEFQSPDVTPLVFALSRKRYDVFEWLLASGADPNLTPNQWIRPFKEALRFGDTTAALALLRAGARAEVDPADVMVLLAESPVEGRVLVLEYLDRYGRITDGMIELMVYSNYSLLPELARSTRPVELAVSEWRAGRLLAMPRRFREELAAQPTKLADIEKLYARGTRGPATDVMATYETRNARWQFTKRAGNKMQDEEFLLLATSFCVHFLAPADCGPPEVLRNAAAWLAASSLPCTHQRSRSELDALACQVSMNYLKIQSADMNSYSVIVRFDAAGQGTPPINLDQLCDQFASSRAVRH